MKARDIHDHVLLDVASSDGMSALAYPANEAEAVYFWSL